MRKSPSIRSSFKNFDPFAEIEASAIGVTGATPPDEVLMRAGQRRLLREAWQNLSEGQKIDLYADTLKRGELNIGPAHSSSPKSVGLWRLQRALLDFGTFEKECAQERYEQWNLADARERKKSEEERKKAETKQKEARSAALLENLRESEAAIRSDRVQNNMLYGR
jgi:hypothetical protein